MMLAVVGLVLAHGAAGADDASPSWGFCWLVQQLMLMMLGVPQLLLPAIPAALGPTPGSGAAPAASNET